MNPEKLNFTDLKIKETWTIENADRIAEFFGYQNNEAFQSLLLDFIQQLSSTNEYGMRVAERAFLNDLITYSRDLEKLDS